MSAFRSTTLAVAFGLIGLSLGLGLTHSTAHADTSAEVSCRGFDARQLQAAADFLKDQIREGHEDFEVVPVGDFTLVCAH